MATPPHILTKVKFLFKLGTSPNPHEAESAKKLAESLIAKYNITEEELKSIEDKAPLYSDDELLFHTFSIVGWMNQLALAIARHFDCYIVQETLVSSLGEKQYNYFVYGGDEEVNYVKFVYATFHKKIHHFVDTKCIGRGPVYIDSYCAGLAEAIKQNIEFEGIEIPTIKRPSRTPVVEQIVSDTTKKAMVAPDKDKAPPLEERIDVASQSFIKDVMAYFRGIEDGQHLSLQDVLELEAENEEAQRLSGGKDD